MISVDHGDSKIIFQEIAEPPSIISEKLWLSGEVPSDWKNGNITHLKEREEAGPEELHVGKPSLCTWENYGTENCIS